MIEPKTFQEYRKLTGDTPSIVAIFGFPFSKENCVEYGKLLEIPVEIEGLFDAPLEGLEPEVGIVWIKDEYLEKVPHVSFQRKLREAYDDLRDTLEIY